MFSKTYDGQVFEIILHAQEDYKALVKDICSFDTIYEINYYCRAFIETIIIQFEIPELDENVF